MGEARSLLELAILDVICMEFMAHGRDTLYHGFRYKCLSMSFMSGWKSAGNFRKPTAHSAGRTKAGPDILLLS